LYFDMISLPWFAPYGKKPLMGFRGGMNELMRQVARVQRKIEQLKEEMKDEEVTGTSADGKVQAVVTCEGKVKAFEIDPEFLKTEGPEIALAALAAATNLALESANKQVDQKIEAVKGGLKIPGMT
jgi:nucleoid-associated protein EbfC